MARWNLGLRGARLKKRVGTADVSVMEINLTAEKNCEEDYVHCCDNDHHADLPVINTNIARIANAVQCHN